MITYPIPENKRRKRIWSVYDDDVGGIVISNRDWPDADGNAVALPPHQHWLETVASPEPRFDSREWQSVPAENIDLVNEEISKTYTLDRLPDEDIKAEIDNQVASEVHNHFTDNDLLTEISRILPIMLQVMDLQDISPKARKKLKRVRRKMIRMADNDDIADALKLKVEDPAKPAINLDAVEWAKPLTKTELTED